MTDENELIFDTATAMNVLLGELIIELVKTGSLSRTQAAKVLLRAESFIDALQFQKDQDESLRIHQLRIERRRLLHDDIAERIQRRLALQPDVGALRFRRRKLAEAYRRRNRDKS